MYHGFFYDLSVTIRKSMKIWLQPTLNFAECDSTVKESLTLFTMLSMDVLQLKNIPPNDSQIFLKNDSKTFSKMSLQCQKFFTHTIIYL